MDRINGKESGWKSGWIVGLRGAITAMQSHCYLVTSVIPHGVILGPVLFSVFINNLDDGILSKFMDVIKCGEVVSALEGRAGMIFSGTSTCWRNELTQNS